MEKVQIDLDRASRNLGKVSRESSRPRWSRVT